MDQVKNDDGYIRVHKLALVALTSAAFSLGFSIAVVLCEIIWLGA